jgi:hypothetical protein
MKLYRSKAQGDIAADTYKIKKGIKLKIFLKFRKESEISKLTHMSKTQKLKAETYKIEKRKIKKIIFFFKKVSKFNFETHPYIQRPRIEGRNLQNRKRNN